MTNGTARRSGRMEVGLVVGDLEAATIFYRDLLGLQFLVDLPIPNGLMRRFSHGESVVKLVKFDAPQPLANPGGGISGRATGLRYFTLEINDVEPTVQRCLAAGVSVPVPVKKFGQTIFAMIADPEGNWIEVIQTGP